MNTPTDPAASNGEDLRPVVFVVDDDPSIRCLVAAELEHAGCTVQAFESGEDFLAAVTSESHGCLLLDIDMPRMTGLQLQAHLTERKIRLPIIFLTSTADVPTTVTLMKKGAVDLIEKSSHPSVILKAVHLAIAVDAEARTRRAKAAEIRLRVETLTPREREVAGLVARGFANKQIAATLFLSERTVEIHRSRVMSKMQTDSVAHFVLQWTAAMNKDT